MKKRLIVYILIIQAFISALVNPVFAEETYLTKDVQKKIDFLIALGVIEPEANGSIYLESLVSRMEMAEMIVKALNITPYGTGESAFFDMRMYSEEQINVVETLSAMGIINGYNGMFEPDRTVSFAEFAKICVCITGYDIFADSVGGYPDGYLTVASQNDMLDGINYSANEKLSRADICQILYNVLHVDVMELDEEIGGASYYEGNTILETEHNVYLSRGRVTGIAGYSLDGTTLNETTLQIDNNYYLLKSPHDYKLMGREVEYYYYNGSKTHDDFEVFYIEELEAKLYETTSNDIISYNNYSFNYIDDAGRAKQISFTKASDIIYNGQPILSPVETMFQNLTNADVIGYDYDKDDICEVLYITEFKTIFASKLDAAKKVAYDKYNPKKYVCLDREEKTIILLSDSGESVLFEELKEGDVLSVAESLDGKRIFGYLCSRTVEGTIEASRKDGAVSYITVSGREYIVEPDFAKQTKEYQIGKTAVFYLDFRMQIAGTGTEIDGTRKFGYLITSYMDTEGVIPKVTLKIYTDSGIFQLFEAADKVLLNTAGTEQIIKLESSAITIKNLEPQLIVYELNNKAQIKAIETAKTYQSSTLAKDYTQGFRKLIGRNSANNAAALNADGYQLGGKAVFDVGADIFLIPSNDYDNEDAYFVGKIKDHMIGRYYDIIPYTTLDSDIAEVAVLYNSNYKIKLVSGGYAATTVYLVESVEKALDDNGDVVQLIRGYDEKGTVAIYTNGESFIDDNNIAPGDLIQLGLNANGVALDTFVSYKLSSKKFNYTQNPWLNNENRFDSDMRIAKGLIYSNDGQLVKMYYGDVSNIENATFEELDMYDATTYKIYIVEDGKIEVGSVSDIESHTGSGKADEIIMTSYDGKPGMMVVYK